VQAKINFAQNDVTIIGLVTQNLTLNLSGAAPASGLTVNGISSNAAIATVPATVTFASGTTAVSVPVTTVAIGGPVVIH